MGDLASLVSRSMTCGKLSTQNYLLNISIMLSFVSDTYVERKNQLYQELKYLEKQVGADVTG